MPPPKSLKSSKSLNPLVRVLETEPHLAAWLRRHQLEASLTRTVRAHLPRLLASQVRVTDLRSGQLELTVPSGALSSAIRQQIPELLAALTSQSLEFNGIRIRVQPPAAPIPARTTSSRRPPPPEAPLRALARSLSDGPLKDAICKMLTGK